MSFVAPSETAVVPADWTTVRIGDLGIIQTGSTPPPSNRSLYGHSFMFVSPADMGQNKYITRTQKMLSPAGFKQSRCFARDSVLFVCIGSTIGKIGIAAEDLTSNQQINSVTPGRGVDPEYLYYAMSTISDVVKSQAGAQAVPLVNKSDFSDFTVALPAVEEQRRIAKALGDSDALVTDLERLIAKKQAMKQGMIQQLLTGKTRLPGFTALWTKQTLGSIGNFLKGRGVKRDDVLTSGIPCIRYGEIYTAFNDYTTTTKSFVGSDIAATALPLRSGDLLFAGSGETRDEIGKCVAYVGPTPAVAGGDIVVLRGDGFNPIYLGLLANTSIVVDQKSRAGQGDAVVHISSRALAEIEMELPPRDEQDAIAEVVVDADREISSIHGRLAKAQSIKQGMMQELLTGRTRLASVEVNA